MARIKITQTTVCDKDYYNIELLGVFLEDVAIVGGGYTKEEAMADIKAEAQTWLEYEIEEAKVEQYCNGYRVDADNDDDNVNDEDEDGYGPNLSSWEIINLAKLLAEPAKPVKEEPKFKVGELVRIRQWDDMEKEYGLDEGGNISINSASAFVISMQPLCGKYAEIVSFNEGKSICLKFFGCEGLEYLTEIYSFDTDMIEKVD